MSIIGPFQTLRDLQASAQRVRHAQDGGELPAVKGDALTMNPKADETNRKLGELISAALAVLKPEDTFGSLFVLGWRLYPNKDHPHWRDHVSHGCGCGCGGAAGKNPRRRSTRG